MGVLGMNDRTTIYIEPELKNEVKIQLIRQGEKQSLSSLINILLKDWLEKQQKD